MMDTTKTYSQTKAEVNSEQTGMSRAEIASRAAKGTLPIGKDQDGKTLYAPKAEAVFDPENTQSVLHHWVDRGTHFSCEGAMHDSHIAKKRMG